MAVPAIRNCAGRQQSSSGFPFAGLGGLGPPLALQTRNDGSWLDGMEYRAQFAEITQRQALLLEPTVNRQCVPSFDVDHARRRTMAMRLPTGRGEPSLVAWPNQGDLGGDVNGSGRIGEGDESLEQTTRNRGPALLGTHFVSWPLIWASGAFLAKGF
jgi:hypothetical protein